jgi:multidrug efflux pump
LWLLHQYFTLLGIVLATGLVVDDGIVVTENIYKKIEEGMAVRKAAFAGSAEIFFRGNINLCYPCGGIFAGNVFQGFHGPLVSRVCGGGGLRLYLISAFVSLSLTPMLSVKFIRKDQKKSKFYEQAPSRFL